MAISARRTAERLSGVISILFAILILLEVGLRVAYGTRNAFAGKVPLPYMIGHEYIAPPWIDGLRILEPDDLLIWKTRPKLVRTYVDVFSPVDRERDRSDLLQRFLPSVPASLAHNPVWTISINADGFRDEEFTNKPVGVFRIVCIGDSWTFGANVGENDTYPRQLRRMLAKRFPAVRFHVLNLGVLGHSSFQGRRVLEQQIDRLRPDLVVVGFGMNDGSVAGYRDKDIASGAGTQASLVERLRRMFLPRMESYRLLQYLRGPRETKALREHLRAAGGPDEKPAEKAVDYAELEPWTRVAPMDYEKNVRAIIELTRRNKADVVLLLNELWVESPYADVLNRIAQDTGVPFVNSARLINDARQDMERGLARRLGLREGGSAGTTGADGRVPVLFRVYAEPTRIVPHALSIVGPDPQLGALVPNRIAMHDDGTDGDERTGDRVWSYVARFRPGQQVGYVFTNSGQPGEWEGLDVPQIRSFVVRVGDEAFSGIRPIETFGRIYLQADPWHTDASGYHRIATAILRDIERHPRLVEHLRSTAVRVK